MICCALVLFSGLIHDENDNSIVGYLTITLICALIFYNLMVIIYDLLCFVRLLVYRYRVQLKRISSMKLLKRNKQEHIEKTEAKLEPIKVQENQVVTETQIEQQ